MKKAKYNGKYYSKYEKAMMLEYEYRGITYTIKAGWNCEPERWQHRSNQAEIDRILDTKCTATENAQVGLDMFFEQFEI